MLKTIIYTKKLAWQAFFSSFKNFSRGILQIELYFHTFAVLLIKVK
jgi:hypothetical protein